MVTFLLHFEAKLPLSVAIVIANWHWQNISWNISAKLYLLLVSFLPSSQVFATGAYSSDTPGGIEPNTS